MFGKLFADQDSEGDAFLTQRKDVLMYDGRNRRYGFIRIFSTQPRLNPHTQQLINAALEANPNTDVVIIFQRPG